ncbi:MAG: glutamate--tRNA ligase [Deltaproteobacteria bacterium]|nr:glutamate--tRNA ligase [Deltaproteobacteria bacterium]
MRFLGGTMVRVRFAPSPTGYLHIGGARTALFNYLFARNQGGRFILRIEDTDQNRSTDESVGAILKSMRWLGLDWDEGPEVGGPFAPYFQSQRLHIYKQYAELLVEKGFAYRCYCSADELEKKREENQKKGLPTRYDRKCRWLKEEKDLPYAIRFKVPENILNVEFEDLLHDKISVSISEIEDFVILKSDGYPTYNFSCVIDDVLMQITHIIRGDDHINNTPKQVLIYNSLGMPMPVFVHLPMILGSDKTRLSKRHGATSIGLYEEMGYLPEAMVNYLVRLGWSYGDQEIFSKQELIEKFSLNNLGRSSAVFNPEKLLWLNQHYIKSLPVAKIANILKGFLNKKGIFCEDENKLEKIVLALRERAKTILEMSEKAMIFFEKDVVFEEGAKEKFITDEIKPILSDVVSELRSVNDISIKSLEGFFAQFVEKRGIKFKAIAQPLRVALCGKTVGPGIFEMIEIFGKDESIRRISSVL